MPKFRKRPIVVEAEQFFPECEPWPEGVYCLGGRLRSDPRDSATWCRVDTLEGPLRVSRGDWIITGVQGEKYPCKPDVFALTYEPAEGSEADGG